MAMSSSKKSCLLQALLMISALAVAAAASSGQPSPGASATANLTLHNLCPYPVWPLVTPNTGFPSISGNTGRLDGGGRGLVSFRFPPSFWAGRVVARTGCGSAGSAGAACETGSSPPETVVQLVVHAEGQDLAAHSVSLVDGFNVPAVVSPQAVPVGGGQCPALGCEVDLNAGCPRAPSVFGAWGTWWRAGAPRGTSRSGARGRSPRPPTWIPCRSGASGPASSRSSSASPPW